MIKEIQQVCYKCATNIHLPSRFRGSSSVVEDLHSHHLFGRLIQALGHLTEDTTAHQLQHTVLTRIAGEDIADFKWDGEKKTLSSYQQLSELSVSLCNTQWWNLTTYKVQADFHQISKSIHFNFATLYYCNININNNNNDINKDNNTFKSTFLATQGHFTEYRVIKPVQDDNTA